MPRLFPPPRLFTQTSSRPTSTSTRTAARQALAARDRLSTSSAPFPIIKSCPPSTCTCSTTPEGLDIDRFTPLNGTIAPYNQHVLISTGQADWTSRIEDEGENGTNWGRAITELKGGFGRSGEFHDPRRNILISSSSFIDSSSSLIKTSPSADVDASMDKPTKPGLLSFEAYTFPAFTRLTATKAPPSAIFQYLSQSQQYEPNTTIQSHRPPEPTITIQQIHHPLLLICSHNSRDSRCGILGPLLHKEFSKQLTDQSIQDQVIAAQRSSTTTDVKPTDDKFRPKVGMISHIGGHKWAGNLIIYIPPTWKFSSSPPTDSSLAGKAIWYGRVEPRHVQGIIEETVMQGRVIGELLRGVVDEKGSMVRV